jgi:hypothetical protein
MLIHLTDRSGFIRHYFIILKKIQRECKNIPAFFAALENETGLYNRIQYKSSFKIPPMKLLPAISGILIGTLAATSLFAQDNGCYIEKSYPAFKGIKLTV